MGRRVDVVAQREFLRSVRAVRFARPTRARRIPV